MRVFWLKGEGKLCRVLTWYVAAHVETENVCELGSLSSLSYETTNLILGFTFSWPHEDPNSKYH